MEIVLNTKRHTSHLNKTLEIAIFFLPLLVVNPHTLAATITFQTDIYNFFFNPILINDQGFISNDQGINLEIITQANPSNTNTEFLVDLATESSANQDTSVLSLSSIVESLSKIQLNGKISNSAPVPILPRVRYSDIYKGIYAFESTATNQNFNQVSSNSLTSFSYVPNLTGTPGKSRPAYPGGIGTINSPGSPISVGRIGPNNSIGVNPIGGGFVAGSGISARIPGSNFSLPEYSAELLMLPQRELPQSVSNINGNITQRLNKLDEFGKLEIQVNFSMLPQQILGNSLNLQEDNMYSSKILNNELKILPAIQQKLQRKLNKKVEEQTQEQQRKSYKLFN